MAILCISNANLVPELKFPLAPPLLIGGDSPLPCYGGPPPRLGGPPYLGGPLPQPLFLLLRFPRPLGEGGGVGEWLHDLLPLGSPASEPASSIGYSIVASLSDIAVK